MLSNDQFTITHKCIKINKPQISWSGMTWRVEAEIAGHFLWIESEHQLRATAETFVCIALLPAMKLGADIHIDAGLDPLFVENLELIQSIFSHWWPEFLRIKVTCSEYRTVSAASRSAMFFTGGVDSFFTLKRQFENVSAIINVEGFDIPIRDLERRAKNADLIKKISAETGKELIRVATNLRDHPFFSLVQWGAGHIAAIASIGHALSGSFSTVYVASSDVPPPWGSHQDLDPLWRSSRLNIINDGWESNRFTKVLSLREWNIVGKYLKVCWENRSHQLNCGECEKCVRTQAAFHMANCQYKLDSFPERNLIELIDQLQKTTGELLNQWKDLRKISDGAFHASISALINRSE